MGRDFLAVLVGDTVTLHISNPEAGYYQVRLAKGAVWTPILVFRPCPIDPDYGYPMQRFPQLRCLVDGEEVSSRRLEQLWPFVRRITEAEYTFLIALHADARAYEPDSPFANVREPVDLGNMPPVYR